MHVKMLDGTTAVVETWDNTNGGWRFTKLGKHFYKDSTDTYLVTFPIQKVLIRHNGSEWKEDTVLKSTAIPLGEIKLPALMPEAEQLAEVKRRTLAYVASLPRDDDANAVVIEGEGSEPTATLDESSGFEYNREEVWRSRREEQPEGGASHQ